MCLLCFNSTCHTLWLKVCNSFSLWLCAIGVFCQSNDAWNALFMWTHTEIKTKSLSWQINIKSIIVISIIYLGSFRFCQSRLRNKALLCWTSFILTPLIYEPCCLFLVYKVTAFYLNITSLLILPQTRENKKKLRDTVGQRQPLHVSFVHLLMFLTCWSPGAHGYTL